MKDLSIEEKAKAYDEAVINGSRLWECGNITRETYEYIFPELKESEDERIIKSITRLVKAFYDVNFPTPEGFERKDILAWLEKRGEQNLANSTKTCKIEPKFRVGDWLVCKAAPKFTAFKIGDVVQISNKETLKLFLMFEDCFRKWTIEDARDGDVISFNDGHGNDCIELIKSITDKKIEFWFCLTNGNRYEVFDGFLPYTNLASKKDATPATKEQCDLLFQKMHEAGYEWNAEKKELRKDEQKPAWNEEDEQRVENLLAIIEGHGYPSEVRWLKDLKDRVQLQSRQEWSEEDIMHLTNAIIAAEEEWGTESCTAKWLKSFKDRFGCEVNCTTTNRPQNWTKEDKERYISCLQRLGTGNPEQPETINSKWFKEHVYPQTTWKPSDYQLEALDSATENCAYSEYQDCLRELIEQLKKLKG